MTTIVEHPEVVIQTTTVKCPLTPKRKFYVESDLQNQEELPPNANLVNQNVPNIDDILRGKSDKYWNCEKFVGIYSQTSVNQPENRMVPFHWAVIDKIPKSGPMPQTFYKNLGYSLDPNLFYGQRKEEFLIVRNDHPSGPWGPEISGLPNLASRKEPWKNWIKQAVEDTIKNAGECGFSDHAFSISLPMDRNELELLNYPKGSQYAHIESNYNFFVRNYENVIESFRIPTPDDDVPEWVLPSLYIFAAEIEGRDSVPTDIKKHITLNGGLGSAGHRFGNFFVDVLNSRNGPSSNLWGAGNTSQKLGEKDQGDYFNDWSCAINEFYGQGQRELLEELKPFSNMVFPYSSVGKNMSSNLIDKYSDRKELFPMRIDINFSTPDACCVSKPDLKGFHGSELTPKQKEAWMKALGLKSSIGMGDPCGMVEFFENTNTGASLIRDIIEGPYNPQNLEFPSEDPCPEKFIRPFDPSKLLGLIPGMLTIPTEPIDETPQIIPTEPIDETALGEARGGSARLPESLLASLGGGTGGGAGFASTGAGSTGAAAANQASLGGGTGGGVQWPGSAGGAGSPVQWPGSAGGAVAPQRFQRVPFQSKNMDFHETLTYFKPIEGEIQQVEISQENANSATPPELEQVGVGSGPSLPLDATFQKPPCSEATSVESVSECRETTSLRFWNLTDWITRMLDDTSLSGLATKLENGAWISNPHVDDSSVEVILSSAPWIFSLPSWSLTNPSAVASILGASGGISPMDLKTLYGINSTALALKMNKFVRDNARSFLDILNGEQAYTETILYRVEKKSVSVRPYLGPGREGGIEEGAEAIQNFYFWNTNDTSEINFSDTQVKYDKGYIYRIYAYNVVIGTRYEYDLKSVRDDDAELCVFTLPSVKLVEVPIYSSIQRVMDSPPIAPEIEFIPSRCENNKISMILNGGLGEYKMPPTIIEDADAQFYLDLLKSQNMFTPFINLGGRENRFGNMLFKSDDYPSLYEVYRTTNKPSSYQDFKGQLLAVVEPASTKLLTERESNWNNNNESTVGIFNDIIIPNQRYFYMFRTIDNHDHLSNPSQVYSVEIIDEGGAIYPVIETFDFDTEKNASSNKPGKRFIQIVPTYSQYAFNEKESSIAKPSAAQMNDAQRRRFFERREPGCPGNSNVKSDLFSLLTEKDISLGLSEKRIWGKKFKIRLISKKSGKKVDLNIDFKYS